MKKKNRESWIDMGYQLVSQKGFRSINIESLSRALKKNKSSFYHYFGDLEIFIEELLGHHLERAEQFSQQAKACATSEPRIFFSAA